MIMLDIAGEKLWKLDKVSNKTNVISSRNRIKRLAGVSYPWLFRTQSFRTKVDSYQVSWVVSHPYQKRFSKQQ